ncbi:MAG: hypothetical protein K2Y56_22145 [Methylobacterium sp.]|uniref:hypothetical protein n=1 Tax=Methylobacterium sp. TaxID=409 RepID=UPI0025D16053|nr:hypothetical protein [Methylobacterium sp.]MBX9934187.1 hypothetical protein [Methylobacterium sp.]
MPEPGTYLVSCSTDPEQTLEQRTIAVHRHYLAALMRIEALVEADTAAVSAQEHVEAEAAHLQAFAILNLFLSELGYVPKGLATRSDLAMALACEAAPRGEARQPDLTTRAVARAEAQNS